jgi:hypothetical protein
MRKAARQAELAFHHPHFASIRVVDADRGSGSDNAATASGPVAVTVYGHGAGFRSRPPDASRSVTRPSHRALVGASRELRHSTHVMSSELASRDIPSSKRVGLLAP